MCRGIIKRGTNERRKDLSIRIAQVAADFDIPHEAVLAALLYYQENRGAIDALGGVTVTVPRRIHDPRYPTDDYGYNVVENPVHVHDLNATILHLLGFDHTRLTFRSQGRDFRLTDVHGEVVKGILA